SQGLACLATDLSGIPELIVDGETGVLVPSGEPAALARALAALIADPARRARLGRAGEARVRREFDMAAGIDMLAARFGLAPLPRPDHPVPSGDRRVAQLFLAALRAAGHRPFVASRLRSYDGDGDPRRQQAAARRGAAAAARLAARWRRAPAEAPAAWFTYHLYYKAPDRIG